MMRQASRSIIRCIILFMYLCYCAALPSLGWGFFAHKQINKHAVFTLPPGMFAFYKQHIHFITENAINPDKRRYVRAEEAPRHYIDLEYYEALSTVPTDWSQAIAVYGDLALTQHGILPWHIPLMQRALTAAFRKKDVYRILRLSADIGHYIADAHVPLHTSENYDGQLSGQEGIHRLWESRLPELFIATYDFFVGQAAYIHDPQQSIWQTIVTAHQAVGQVLSLEKALSSRFPAIQKYSFEQRGGTLYKVHAVAYAHAYHMLLDGLVERQMRASIKMVGDFWFTCWVDAGQPDLDALRTAPLCTEQLQEDFPQHKQLPVRGCGP